MNGQIFSPNPHEWGKGHQILFYINKQNLQMLCKESKSFIAYMPWQYSWSPDNTNIKKFFVFLLLKNAKEKGEGKNTKGVMGGGQTDNIIQQ